MRIEEDLKLGFKDVLIRPKRSTLKSRSDVELEREFTFKHSGQTWSGVPIIAANMDTVGTFSMAQALATFGILTAVHMAGVCTGRVRRRPQACDGFHRHFRCGFRKDATDPLSESATELCVHRRG